MEELPLKIFTVSELTSHIRDLLEGTFDEVLVEGEISNLRVPRSGHIYFTLKDEQSQIRVVIFRNQSRYLRFEPEDGQHVLCWGRVSVYEPRGEYQLLVDYMEPKGVGALQLAFEQLKRKLAEEGLFDPERKRPLPLLPRRIGIVTSPTGAVIRDMLQILRRRFENIEVLLYPVRVQGEGAAEEIARGVDYLGARGDVDVIIVARGGGSLEDLWAFNEEVVARSIFRCPVPVVSAVGHETDYTIADFVADVRAPTPSAAAELVVKRKDELKEAISTLERGLLSGMYRLISLKEGHLEQLKGRLKDPRSRLEERGLRLAELEGRIRMALERAIGERQRRLEGFLRLLEAHSPGRLLASVERRIDEGEQRLVAAIKGIVADRERGLEAAAGKLDSLSPLGVLRRGYSITWRLPDRSLVKDACQVEEGDQVEITLAEGKLWCEVKRKEIAE